MEQIEVVARFDRQGQVTPLRFIWKGRDYLVESTGRQWQAEDGRHFLVMTPGGKMFELRYAPGNNRWYLQQAGQPTMLA